MISYYLQHQHGDQATNSLGNKMRFAEERIMSETKSTETSQQSNTTNSPENKEDDQTKQNNEKPLEFDDGKHESYLSDRITAFARWHGKISTTVLSEFVGTVGNISHAIFNKNFQ
jgi:hypothetical protein